MASRAISGKPGGGKSYYAVTLLLDELTSSDRYIVTNLELDETFIADFLAKKGRSDIDVFSRVTRLDDPKADEAKKVSDFWRYRGGGVVLPSIPESDIKAGVRPDVGSFGPGVHYFLDELHKFLNSRQWASTGPLLLWYISQHRHFGDDVTWITQHVPNVDKQWRSVTQDYSYCRNAGKEKFRGMTKGKNFTVESYLEPFTGTQTLQEKHTLVPDWDGIGKCYHTSVAHGAADKGKFARGWPVWWLYVGIGLVTLLACFGFIYGPGLAAKWMIHKSESDAVKLRERMGGVSSPAGSGVVGHGRPSVLEGAPLDTPPIASKEVFNLGVPLKNISVSELLASLIGGIPDVLVRPSPFGGAVVLSGNSLQGVSGAADMIRQLDVNSSEMVVVQGLVVRTVKSKGSDVGVWRKLQDVLSAPDSVGSLAFNPLTGILTMGSIQAARDLLLVVGSQDVRRGTFRVESRPILAATSGQEAWFSSGQEVPVPVTTQTVGNAQTSISYKTIQFSLGVTPTCLPGGSIALLVKQSNGDILSSSVIGGNSIPTISTQSLFTRLELREGQIAVIGGIHTLTASDQTSGVPLIGSFPPFSWLFGNRGKKQEDSELLVFLTVYRVPSGANPSEVRRADLVKPISSHVDGRNGNLAGGSGKKRKQTK